MEPVILDFFYSKTLAFLHGLALTILQYNHGSVTVQWDLELGVFKYSKI